jgi:hypothetical protein
MMMVIVKLPAFTRGSSAFATLDEIVSKLANLLPQLSLAVSRDGQEETRKTR